MVHVLLILKLEIVSDKLGFHWQPFHLELNFFNKQNRVLHYPVRAFYVEGANLMAYNLTSGVDSIYKKLYTSVGLNFMFMKTLEPYTASIYNSCVDYLYLKGTIVFLFQIPGNIEFHPKYILHSRKQHLFLVVHEFSGVSNEVSLYWENTDSQLANSKISTIKGSSCLYTSCLFLCCNKTFKFVYEYKEIIPHPFLRIV